jgi:hypothetical protein
LRSLPQAFQVLLASFEVLPTGFQVPPAAFQVRLASFQNLPAAFHLWNPASVGMSPSLGLPARLSHLVGKQTDRQTGCKGARKAVGFLVMELHKLVDKRRRMLLMITF